MTTMTLKLIKNRLKLLEAPAISPLASRENWQWKETSIILQPTLVSREQNEGLCIRFFLWCDTAHLTNFGASRGGIHTTKGLETATDQHGNCIIWLYYMYIFLWEIPLALCIYISMPFVLLIAVEHKYVGPIIHVRSQNIIYILRTYKFF